MDYLSRLWVYADCIQLLILHVANSIMNWTNTNLDMISQYANQCMLLAPKRVLSNITYDYIENICYMYV